MILFLGERTGRTFRTIWTCQTFRTCQTFLTILTILTIRIGRTGCFWGRGDSYFRRFAYL